jgi:hypothetical protein
MKKFIEGILDFFSDEENPEEAGYDPSHLAAMIVLVLFSMTVLFWLLWALLVFNGGIQSKIIPSCKVLFTGKTAADFGYIGYPYEMGAFEGWVTNVVALVFLMLVVGGISYIFNRKMQQEKRNT